MTTIAPPVSADAAAKARALSSPIRLRILRLCLHQPRTNKELADILGVNPGSLLHHVRALVATGFLAMDAPRRGTRGAKEIPYRATGLTWHDSEAPLVGPVLVETFLQEIQGVQPMDLQITRAGLRLTPSRLEEFIDRLSAVIEEFVMGPQDEAGEPWSLMLAVHPDLQQASREAASSDAPGADAPTPAT